ncbi:carboxymuconolactone decarboxylase family protein [Sulfurivermis fontis]|uniref:carboxymuconolactone decarboxylase family protein n=1 Tax=Sulfurivermis fontis TaxID=1972068 RepID=UPI000FD96D45|nr:carboxymuconolactone decarboxylase family protein [Sulfurivermis fontis]
MSNLFPLHTSASAPAAAQPLLEAASQAFGFVPNLIAIMASSPALTEAYLALSAIFEQKTSLTPTERQVVLLAVSRYHACRYCVAAHSTIADMQGIPPAVVEAIRSDQPIADTRLEALRSMVNALLERRALLPDATLESFFSAGYTPAQLLDVLVGVAQKTLSNFTNHLAGTPLDEPMHARAWTPAERLPH